MVDPVPLSPRQLSVPRSLIATYGVYIFCLFAGLSSPTMSVGSGVVCCSLWCAWYTVGTRNKYSWLNELEFSVLYAV